MRGCALPLTKLSPPPYLCCNAIIGNSFFPFPTAAAAAQPPPCHSHSLTTIHTQIPKPRLKATAESSSSASVAASQQQQQGDDDGEEEEEEESFQVLTALKSDYNDIIIVDTPKSRMLLLDSSHNVHSILYKDQKWTGSYWDEFASLPAIVPNGPIAILGLGGGTAAHLMLDLWPSLQLDGWEIDGILIDKARDYFGLSDLEKTTQDGGILNVHIGDVFNPSENLYKRYAGIVVDLFSDGKVLPQLQEVNTWLELHKRLMPDGRFMVNCGGIDVESSAAEGITDPENLSNEETWLLNPTLKALHKSFPGQVSWKRMAKERCKNFMAVTGPLPDMEYWCASVPSPLSNNVKDWKALQPSF